MKNGEIWWYQIEVVETSSDKLVYSNTTTKTYYNAMGLEPFKNYTFKVSARGSAGYSKQVTVKGETFTSSE